MDSFVRGLVKHYRKGSSPQEIATGLKNCFQVGLLTLDEIHDVFDMVYAVAWCPSCGAHESASNLYLDGKSITDCPRCGKRLEFALN